MTTNEAGILHTRLRSLRLLAQDLETQLAGERNSVDRLAVLAEHQLPLGAFGEAFELGMCHLVVAEQMCDLLRVARDVVCFACGITHTIATGHHQIAPFTTPTRDNQPQYVYADSVSAPCEAQPRTDFASFDHATLVMMLHDSDPATVTAAAETWAAVGHSLYDRAGTIEREQRGLDSTWRGEVATAYRTMIADLVEGIVRTATVALAIRDLTYHEADALHEALLRMPPPAAATHWQAVAVMTRLAEQDAAIEMVTPPPPTANGPCSSVNDAAQLFSRVFRSGQAAVASLRS
jgi:hypothetical protein